jgi:hypothetical protein
MVSIRFDTPVVVNDCVGGSIFFFVFTMGLEFNANGRLLHRRLFTLNVG